MRSRPLACCVGFLVLLASYTQAATLEICSFNIQFLGHFKDRDDESLAALVKDFDIVFVQELVTPPTSRPIGFALSISNRGSNSPGYLMTADPMLVRVMVVSRIRGPLSEYVPGARKSRLRGAASPWAPCRVS